jgi:eukaryotic-like serine/threonine-protein kinase
MADRLGQRFGNYQLIRLLGEGGFAEVYLGEHIHLGMQAAIKVLHTQLTSNDMEQFRTEARTIARLEHPHIVRILEFGMEGKTPFLVMSYAPNGTLRQRHPKGVQLPFATIVTYVKQVADALEYAHDEKLIHRDIKPENMLVGRRNEILLSDFGIALVAQSSRYQSTQEMAGTMAYIAPEQIQGHPRPASDQYSLGIVVYEWISGDRPFHGSLTELVGQHLSVPPPPLREKVSTISPVIEQVVLTALAKEPKERFGGIQAFANALEQACQPASPHPVALSTEVPFSNQPSLFPNVDETILPGQASQSTNIVTPSSQLLEPTIASISHHTPEILPPLTKESVPSRGIQAHKPHISRRVILVGLAGLAGVSIVGGGFVWQTLSQKPQISSFLIRTTTPTTSTPIPIGTTLLTYRGHSAPVLAVSWSHDGTHIASGGRDRTVQVWDASTGNNPVIYRGHSLDVQAVAWSPDDGHITSGSDDMTVQIWDPSAMGNPVICQGHTQWVTSVAWSPNGSFVASGSGDATVQVFDATNGGNVLTYRGHTDTVRAVAWSPNGTRIASASHDKTVQIWDASTGNNTIICRGHSSWVTSVAWSPNGAFVAAGGDDYTVQVWDASTGHNVLTYQGHSDLVIAVAWSPDGTRIVSGSDDKTVQIWQAL